MFLKTVGDDKKPEYYAYGLALAVLFLIAVAIFYAFSINFTTIIAPLTGVFTSGIGAFFGALLGESTKK